MLTLNQVTWRWPGAADDCLQNISLTLGQGEWLALTGDNGAGKSTLLRVMAGLLSATSGSVNLLNKPMAQYKNRQRAKIIGVLFQEAENQLFHSKVSEEVAYGLRLQKLPAAEVAQRTAAALRLCSLESVADAHPLDCIPPSAVWSPSPVWKPWRQRSCCSTNPAAILIGTGWQYLKRG